MWKASKALNEARSPAPFFLDAPVPYLGAVLQPSENARHIVAIDSQQLAVGSAGGFHQREDELRQFSVEGQANRT
jgi:hypothetical protein